MDKRLTRFKSVPKYIYAIKFTNTPENLDRLSKIENAKFEVDNSKVDAPLLHIEIGTIPLAIPLGGWLVSRNLEEAKWTSMSEKRLFDEYLVADTE